MAGLKEATAALAQLRQQGAPRGARPSPGSLTEVADFGPNPGELRMLVHAPPGLAPNRPLVVVLHGCTQTAEQYAQGAGWTELADRLGLALLCPEQRGSNNANRCFNWFEPGDVRRGEGEAASIRAMIDAAALRFGCDRKQVFVTGLSAGGAMASVMLAAYPELFAGGGIVAGLAYGVAAGMPQAFGAMLQGPARPAAELGRLVRQASSHQGPWPRVSVWHGSADTTVKPANGDAVARQWLDIHGLEESAGAKSGADGHIQWSRDGVCLVERRLIGGMGHGTPLSTGGPDGVGRAGPFLLESGVSSSLELARFWGVAGVAQASEPAAPRAAPAPAARRPMLREPAQTGGPAPGAANDEHGVGAVINRALRAAGLLK
jgi:poly(hydroxyalkanoate) depolymerase family esterase